MTASAVIGFAMKKSIFCYHRLVRMKCIWSKLFWKIILPFVVAFAQAIVWVLFGRIPTFGISLRAPNISVYVSAATFVVCLVVAFWNTLRWSKEAEVFESELREADKIEKERRRRSEWTER
jgi:ABC-type nickel/cobalt efflux system permease component RcnA